MSISEEIIRTEICSRVRQAVETEQESQRALAGRIGVAQGFLSEVIRGLKMPSIHLLIGMGRELGVSLDWILLGRGAVRFRDKPEGARGSPRDHDPHHNLLAQILAEASPEQKARLQGYLEGLAAAQTPVPQRRSA